MGNNISTPSPDLCQAVVDTVPLPDQVCSRIAGPCQHPSVSIPTPVNEILPRPDPVLEGQRIIPYEQLWKERVEARKWARVSVSELARTQSYHDAAELYQRIAGLETTVETQNLQVSHLHTAWLALRDDVAQTPDLVLALHERLAKILVLPPTMTIPQVLVEANQFLDWFMRDAVPRTGPIPADAGHQGGRVPSLPPQRPLLT